MSLTASVVVDTMVVSALVNAGRDSGAAERCRSIIDGRSVVVSFVTVTEMRFGAIKAGWGEIRRRDRGSRIRRTPGRPLPSSVNDQLAERTSDSRISIRRGVLIDQGRPRR